MGIWEPKANANSEQKAFQSSTRGGEGLTPIILLRPRLFLLS